MIPELAKQAKELHCYQRKPAWVLPRKQFKIPEFVKWIFAYVPFILQLFRWAIFMFHEVLYPLFLHGSWLSRFSKYMVLHFLKLIYS